MLFAVVLAVYVLAAMVNLPDTVTAAFAPVVNSGSAVIAVAFLSGLLTYRRLRLNQ